MFAVIPQDTFEALQVDAGVLLTSFNPASPAAPTEANLITATTGGITVECAPTFSDWGDDVDNCPPNMMELKRLDGWNCRMTTTAIGTSQELIKLALGVADSASGGKVTPRRTINLNDFSDSIWWVGDRADGGLVAVELKNALSTGGFSLKTTKQGKGQFGLELTGHVSLDAQDVVPMVFYSIEGTGGTTGTT